MRRKYETFLEKLTTAVLLWRRKTVSCRSRMGGRVQNYFSSDSAGPYKEEKRRKKNGGLIKLWYRQLHVIGCLVLLLAK